MGGAQDEEKETTGHDGTGDSAAEPPAKIILYVSNCGENNDNADADAELPPIDEGGHGLALARIQRIELDGAAPACMVCGHLVQTQSSIEPQRRRRPEAWCAEIGMGIQQVRLHGRLPADETAVTPIKLKFPNPALTVFTIDNN